MPSKAELEQQVQDLTEERDLAVARLTTLQRESDGRIQAQVQLASRDAARIAELESVLDDVVTTAALLALRCVDSKLHDRIVEVIQ
jgi:hypothetical protein